ncbi:MAG: hypothetical protein AB7V22_06295, partial [Kiritimatiellia bacterium]
DVPSAPAASRVNPAAAPNPAPAPAPVPAAAPAEPAAAGQRDLNWPALAGWSVAALALVWAILLRKK